MKVINFGSINKDYVYQVDNFVRPGETKSSKSFTNFIGGKGNNQSVALARAGCEVIHAGLIGADGGRIVVKMQENGINTDLISFVEDEPTGHAVIQVADSGENSILLYGGANLKVTKEKIKKVLAQAEKGDWLLLQNEINMLPEIMQEAHDKGLKIIFNPAPMTSSVKNYPLHLVDILVINHGEAEELTGKEDLVEIVAALKEQFIDSNTEIVLTRGSEGVIYYNNGDEVNVPAYKVSVADTTAAGDTFIGYFISSRIKNRENPLMYGQAAAALCVMKSGAVDAIPYLADVEKFMNENKKQ